MSIREAGLLSGKTILIVEDEPLVAMSLAEEIEAAGGTVLGPVNSVAAAYRIIETAMVGFAVLDVELDGELVYPLAGELVERSIGFVFTTGHGAQSLSARFRDAAVIEKPFRTNDVIGAISRHGGFRDDA
jgi:DNA-binding response OmpR family regulator